MAAIFHGLGWVNSCIFRLQIEEKANVKYQEWLMEKQERERVKRLEEKEKKKEEERKKEEQRAKSEKAFQEWKQKAKKRPCTAPNSYGYIAGQLTSKFSVISVSGGAF